MIFRTSLFAVSSIGCIAPSRSEAHWNGAIRTPIYATIALVDMALMIFFLMSHTAPSAAEIMLRSEPSRILVADDEPIIANTLAMILNHSGYQALPVYGGRLAVEKARLWPPDLFLGDVSMPELDGIQTAIEICAMFPDCRVLLFPGEPNSRMLIWDARFKGHRFEFLEKPISPLDLLSRIRRLRAA